MNDWVEPQAHQSVVDALHRTIKERDRLRELVAKKDVALRIFAMDKSWEWEVIDEDSQAKMWTWNSDTHANPIPVARQALEAPCPPA